jgi:drug/metabolite transporter (DMT)-like permease
MFATISTAAENRAARLAGIGLMLAGICMFSLGDALGKFLVGTYSVGQLMLLRACAALVLLAPSIWRQRGEFLRLERPGLQIVRVVLSTLEVAAFFLATVYLPLADVITYYLACPIFVTAGSAIFLREPVGWRRWSAVVVGFCGVLIALQPSAQSITWPALIALCGSMSFAALMLITRSLRAAPDIVLATTQFIGTFTFGAVLTSIGWLTPSLRDLCLFFLAGGVSVVALLCVNRSLKLAPASVVVPYQYSMIIWAVLFGYTVFGDLPSRATLAGAAIIISAGLYIFLREQRRGVSRRRSARRWREGCECGALSFFPLPQGRRKKNAHYLLVASPQCFSDDQTLRASLKQSTGVDEPNASKRCSSTPLHWKPHFSSTLRDAGLATRAPEMICSGSNSWKVKSITARAASVAKPRPQQSTPSQ